MMSLARRSLAVVASAAAMMLLMTEGFPLGAQENSTAKSQTTKTKQASASTPTDSSTTAKSTGKTAPPDVTHRVPPGYAKLGLTDQQKERLYKIQAEYYPKIHDLEKKADDLRPARERIRVGSDGSAKALAGRRGAAEEGGCRGQEGSRGQGRREGESRRLKQSSQACRSGLLDEPRSPSRPRLWVDHGRRVSRGQAGSCCRMCAAQRTSEAAGNAPRAERLRIESHPDAADARQRLAEPNQPEQSRSLPGVWLLEMLVKPIGELDQVFVQAGPAMSRAAS